MNKLMTFACALVTDFIFCLPLAMSLQSTTVQAAGTDGSIEFYGQPKNGHQGDYICTLPFASGKYKFREIDECSNDDAYSFQLKNVASATTFSLHDGVNCTQSEDQDWYFVMKTMKNNLTMAERMKIADLDTYTVGQIIPGSGGVRLEQKFEKGQIYGKLSCVNIIRSTPVN